MRQKTLKNHIHDATHHFGTRGITVISAPRNRAHMSTDSMNPHRLADGLVQRRDHHILLAVVKQVLRQVGVEELAALRADLDIVFWPVGWGAAALSRFLLSGHLPFGVKVFKFSSLFLLLKTK